MNLTLYKKTLRDFWMFDYTDNMFPPYKFTDHFLIKKEYIRHMGISQIFL